MHDSPQTARRIALVRHARSAHIHAGWIDAHGFRAWRAAYEAAGIHADERAPTALEQIGRLADVVVSSDAPRAVATARLIAPGRETVVSPLLRELDLDGPALGGVRLPLGAWAVAVGGRTLVQRLRRTYPAADEAARIDDAAAWLDGLADGHALVVAVTHAMARGQVAARLAERGWKAEPGRRSMRPWSAWVLSRG